MLAVEPPLAQAANIGEFCYDHLLPVVRRPESRPLFVENHHVAFDSITNPNLRLDGRRYPFRAVGRQQFLDLCLLHFCQCQSSSPLTQPRSGERSSSATRTRSTRDVRRLSLRPAQFLPLSISRALTPRHTRRQSSARHHIGDRRLSPDSFPPSLDDLVRTRQHGR